MSKHITDVADHEDYRSGNPTPRALVDLAAAAVLAVPLRKDDTFLGDIMIYRARVLHPFSNKQIAFVRTSRRRRSSQWKMRGS